jgi:chaperonin cofactor prefoldin
MDIEGQIGDLTKRIIVLEGNLAECKDRYDQLTGKLRRTANQKRNNNPDDGDEFLSNYGKVNKPFWE